MIKRKYSVIVSAFVLSLIVLGLYPSYTEAHIQSNCSTSSRTYCQAVEILPGEKSGYTRQTYVTRGSYINWGVRTYNNSLYQVSAHLYDADNLTLLDLLGASGSGGENWDSFRAPRTGFYYVILRSGDSSQGRSHAYAWLSTDF